jgi:parvulin-like peptidyl-prolyl isomerase
VVIGVANERYFRPRAPIATVNGVEISARDFQGRVRFQQAALLTEYQNYQQATQLFADNQELLETYQLQQERIAQQLQDNQALADSTIETLIQEQLIRTEAEARGISVSEDETRELIAEAFGFVEESSPEAALGTQNSDPAGVDPEQDPIDPSQETPVPTPTVYTRDDFESDYAAYLEQIQSFGISEQDLLSRVEAQLYRDRLIETFSDEVPRQQEQVNARHILVSEEALALAVLEDLGAGENWEDLAQEFSEDLSNKDQGGDLGWFPRGAMVSEFEEAAFTAEVGATVGPVETPFGWHIIQVNGRETRPLEDTAYNRLLSMAFEDWLESTRSAAEVDIVENLADLVPDLPYLITPQG